jgi:hypothetical protein
VLIGWVGAAAACPSTAPDLLLGHWRGRRGDEHWVALGDAVVGVAIAPEFFELLLAERQGGGAYVARPGGGDATRFPCVAAAPDGVTWENPDHDWPRRVAYARDRRGLTARLGTGGRGDLRLRWRAFVPDAIAIPADAGQAPAAPVWWGDALLDPLRSASIRWALEGTARRGDLVAGFGWATLDGARAPFGAVWRLTRDGTLLEGFAAWPVP